MERNPLRCFSLVSFLRLTAMLLLLKIPPGTYTTASAQNKESFKFSKKDTTYLIELLSLASQTRNDNIELAEKYYRQALEESRALAEVKFEIKANTGLGICRAMQDDYTNSNLFFNEALNLSLRNGFEKYAGDSYNNLGILYKSLGDYPASLQTYTKSLNVYESLKSEAGLASAHENIGVLFDLMKDKDKALEHYQRSLAYYTKTDNQNKLASLQSNIGYLHLNQKDYKKAIAAFEENLDYYLVNKMNTYVVKQRSNLGYAYYLGKEYHKAEKHLLRALEGAEQLGMNEIRINSLSTLAKIKSETGSNGKSIALASAAAALADSSESLTLKSKVAELLSYVFEKNGDHEQGLKYYKRHKALEDSIINVEKIRAYKNQQVLWEVSEKDKKLEKQAFNMALLNDQIELETHRKWFLALVCILLSSVGILYFQKSRIRKKNSAQLTNQNKLISSQKEEIEVINEELEKQVQLRKETDETINYFATSLFGKNETDEILWDVAKNCVARLGFVDCVIYLIDPKRSVLIQKAAYGPKNPEHFVIDEPLEITVGEGIVGAVAQSGIAEIISDTSLDPRYIVDDAQRFSEIAVPLIHQENVIGVIDSEHPDKGFFKQFHLEALQTIASICTSKIAQTQADHVAQKARQAQIEAEQIKQMDQLKSRFFANISHEFRTPLNLILAPLHKNKFPIPAWELEMMGRNAKRLLRLVNQLLDLAKLEVGLVQLENRYINVFKFIGEIAYSFTPLADSRQIRLVIDIPERDFVTYLDPDKLEKIIYNLLSNALKFTPGGGVVTIQLSEYKSDFLCISVSDTGIGIPEELKEKVFNRFFQADSSQTRKYEGTGIGLSLTKELVELMQGTISLESESQKGCTFTVVMPKGIASNDPIEIGQGVLEHFSDPTGFYTETPTVEEEGIVDISLSDKKPLVLIVEDIADLRKYIKSELSDEFTIIEAENGVSGLKIARERIPDIIVTDIMMPEMDGVTMTRHIREEDLTSHIPIILLTARGDGETKLKGFETGAEQYLVKPFEIDELIARVKGLLSRSERLRIKYSQSITLKPEDKPIENRDAQFLKKLVKIVEDNISNEAFTVEHMQQEIGMSRMQLHRKLKALTNQSASDFIRTIRLKRAAQILGEPGISISEAAYLSGFNHMSYFSKCFKDEFGVLPSDYVKTS